MIKLNKQATWVDNTVCTSVVMILLAMIGATSSWCLGTNGPSTIDGVDDGEEQNDINLIRIVLINACFYAIIMLQLMLLVFKQTDPCIMLLYFDYIYTPSLLII